MTDARITPQDLELKFRQVKGGVEDRAKAAKETLMPVAIAAGFVLLFLAYVIGKRVGKKKSTVVEIRRI